MQRGQSVRLRAYGGGVIERRVVNQAAGMVYVCTEEEFENAERQARRPICVGFPVGDVVEAESQPSGE